MTPTPHLRIGSTLEEAMALANKRSRMFDKALAITSGERHESYGHPLDNHGRTAALWSTYLGTAVTAEDVCWMMLLVKVSRQIHAPTDDNPVDVVGYMRNLEMIADERSRRAIEP